MAGRGGIEPPCRDPESRILPLDDLPLFLYCLRLIGATAIRPACRQAGKLRNKGRRRLRRRRNN